jgi:hypothetical protein
MAIKQLNMTIRGERKDGVDERALLRKILTADDDYGLSCVIADLGVVDVRGAFTADEVAFIEALRREAGCDQ